MNKFLRAFRSSLLWVVLAPYAVFGLGAASNQLVLIANHDKFPVMVNPVKLDEMRPQKANALAKIIEDIFGVKPKVAPAVANDDMLDDVHCIMTDQTHLNFLADVFDMHDAIYSVGDFILMLGDWLAGFCPFVFIALVFKKCWDADAI
jgi:hypothetical protein